MLQQGAGLVPVEPGGGGAVHQGLDLVAAHPVGGAQPLGLALLRGDVLVGLIHQGADAGHFFSDGGAIVGGGLGAATQRGAVLLDGRREAVFLADERVARRQQPECLLHGFQVGLVLGDGFLDGLGLILLGLGVTVGSVSRVTCGNLGRLQRQRVRRQRVGDIFCGPAHGNGLLHQLVERKNRLVGIAVGHHRAQRGVKFSHFFFGGL